MKEIFTPDMRLSEIIDRNCNLVQVISRVGIGLRHAGLRASEACNLAGIDSDTFILICNVYSFQDFVPSGEDLAAVSIPDIVRYLHGSHAFYTGIALRNLEAGLNHLVDPCEESMKEVVMKFFIGYKDELEKHFAREENEVFPYVSAILDGRRPEGYSIDQFEEHHERVDEKLEDMKNIVMKYLPGECHEEMRTWVVMELYRLRDDLRRHTYVEDNILVPVVRNLEKDGE